MRAAAAFLLAPLFAFAPLAASASNQPPPWPLNSDGHFDPAVGPPQRPHACAPRCICSKPSRRLRAAARLSGASTGDSTTTLYDYPTGNGGANSIAPSELLYTNLVRAVLAQNPGQAFIFTNRAVGAQTWSTLFGAANANWPSWYPAHGLYWLNYVRAADCDFLFINSGVNDTNGLTAQAIYNVLNVVSNWGTAPAAWQANHTYAPNTQVIDSNGDLEATSLGGTSGASAPTWAVSVNGGTGDNTVGWVNLTGAVYVPKNPDVILITNKNASPNAGAPYNTTASQVGYQTAASFQRTLAQNGGAFLGLPNLRPLGLIDIGREFTQVYNGFDPTQQYLSTVAAQAGVSVTAYPYSFAPNPGGDGDYDVVFSGQATAMGAAATNVVFNIGGPNSGITSDTLKIYKAGATCGWTLNVDGIAGTTGKGSAGSGGVWGTGDLAIKVTAKQSNLWIYCNQTLIANVLLPRWIGAFTPTVTLTSPPSGTTTMTVNDQAIGTPLTRRALFSDAIIFDAANNGTGGNGINHNSSVALAAVDTTVVSKQDFCAICVNPANYGGAPSIASGFGTSPSVLNAPKGPASFSLNVGTGGTATSGVVTMPAAPHGWSCPAEDVTTTSATVFRTKVTATTPTSVTLGNFNTSGAAAAWAAGDVLNLACSRL